MSNIVGCFRVKNEARWIARVLASIMPLCDWILVFDDHSTDGTLDICWDTLVWKGRRKGLVLRSPFDDLNEARDKNHLLLMARSLDPDWIIWIDGDEILTAASLPLIRANLNTPHKCMSFHVRYLWNDEQTVRVDGVYGQFARQSMFRPVEGARFTGQAPGFHCGSVPMSLWGSCCYPGAELLHLGYLNKEDRIRKFRWYNEQDPMNLNEDRYFHMVLGDLPELPADAVRKHGGPLKLEPLNAVSNR